MAHIDVLTDEQLERICRSSTGLCGYNCRQCQAFQANLRYNEGYTDADYGDDEDENEDDF